MPNKNGERWNYVDGDAVLLFTENPVWMPVNMLLVRALLKFYGICGDSLPITEWR